MIQNTPLLSSLEARRKSLGMTYDVVAKRSGASRSTVERVLSGKYGAASFETVEAIAAALGASIAIEETVNCDDMLEHQAQSKAAEIVRMVQGTSALEGQAVDEATYRSMIRQTVHRLLAGSRRTLWAE